MVAIADDIEIIDFFNPKMQREADPNPWWESIVSNMELTNHPHTANILKIWRACLWSRMNWISILTQILRLFGNYCFN